MMASTQIVLTPTEAKRLLSKALLQRDDVKKALREGILMLHPSSTSIFMLEELGIKLHEKGIWICGHVSPKGLCVPRKVIDFRSSLPASAKGEELYPFEYTLNKGELVPFEESAIAPLLDQMTAEDVYVKSVNAIDPDGKTGVLLSGRKTGGSVGTAIKKQKKGKFKVLLPVGLEKRIPISLHKAIKAANSTTKAQGIPCGMWRVHGTVVTEIDAFKQLCDVEAIPISAGGVCGAEGAIVWVLTGEEKKVDEAYRLCEDIHGHELPFSLDVYECETCKHKRCNLVGKKWPPR